MFNNQSNTKIQNRLNEEKIYAQAYAEFERGELRKGLWAKALANSDGDSEKAKSRYLRSRVQSILDEITIREHHQQKIVDFETSKKIEIERNIQKEQSYTSLKFFLLIIGVLYLPFALWSYFS
jgi:hypothetical protein